MVSILCVRLPAAFCIWYQKGVLQGVPGTIIRYHFIMLYTPISAELQKNRYHKFFKVNAERKSKVDDNTAKMQSIKWLGV